MWWATTTAWMLYLCCNNEVANASPSNNSPNSNTNGSKTSATTIASLLSLPNTFCRTVCTCRKATTASLFLLLRFPSSPTTAGQRANSLPSSKSVVTMSVCTECRLWVSATAVKRSAIQPTNIWGYCYWKRTTLVWDACLYVCTYLYHRDQVPEGALDPSELALESPRLQCIDLHSSPRAHQYCVVSSVSIHALVQAKEVSHLEPFDTLFQPPESDLDRSSRMLSGSALLSSNFETVERVLYLILRKRSKWCCLCSLPVAFTELSRLSLIDFAIT